MSLHQHQHDQHSTQASCMKLYYRHGWGGANESFMASRKNHPSKILNE